MKSLLKTMVLALVSGLLLAGCSSGGSPKIGVESPDFHLRDLEGKNLALGNFRGKAVMLNFWSSTCPPCVSEMPHLQEVFNDWSARGVVLLAIDVGENEAAVRSFIQKNRYTFPVLLDSGYDVAGQYNVEFTPTTFFIDKDGIIQTRIVGAFPNKEAIEKHLNQIVPGSSG